jgi:hypothetical protein
MKNLESYLVSPFDSIVVGRDKTLEFFVDHGSKLKQSVANGAPFSKEETDFSVALTALSKSKTDTSVILAQQGSETMNVDNIIQEFKDIMNWLEPKVLIVFPKKSVEYHEFFPNGKSAYSKTTKSTIDNHFATIITACEKHSDKLGTEPAEVMIALKSKYVAARDAQLQKKGGTEGTRSAWDDNLDIVKDLAFHNLLMIADAYRVQPEKISMFFDQSIITPRQHAKDDVPTPEPV